MKTIDQSEKEKLITQDVSEVFREYGLRINETQFCEGIQNELELYSIYGFAPIFVMNVMHLFVNRDMVEIEIDDFQKLSKKIEMKKENASAREKLLEVGKVYYHHVIDRFVYKSNLFENKRTFTNEDFDKDDSLYQKILTNGELNEYQLIRQFNDAEGENFLREKIQRTADKANEGNDAIDGFRKMTGDLKEAIQKNVR